MIQHKAAGGEAALEQPDRSAMMTESPIAAVLETPGFRKRKGASCRHGARSDQGLIKKMFVMVCSLAFRRTCVPCICVRGHAILEGKTPGGIQRTAMAGVYVHKMCMQIVAD